MNRHVNAISGRLSLRQPQRESLEILHRITEIAPPAKEVDITAVLEVIRSEYLSVTDFERVMRSCWNFGNSTFGYASLHLPEPPPFESYNIAPTQNILTVRTSSKSGQVEYALLHWGLAPFLSKAAKNQVSPYQRQGRGDREEAILPQPDQAPAMYRPSKRLLRVEVD
jgi:hypothetical protein